MLDNEQIIVESISYDLLLPTNTAIGGTQVLTDDIEPSSQYQDGMLIWGFSYSIRYLLPVVLNPWVSIALSKYSMTPDLWNTPNNNGLHQGLYSLKTYSNLPANASIDFSKPVYLNTFDKLYVNLFLDNDTGVIFNKDLRLHLTLRYQLASNIKEKEKC